MKIAMVQLNTIVGDLAGNTKKIIRQIKTARKKKADLVCFQELVLSGYPPRDLLELPYFLEKSQKYLDQIIQEAHGIAVCLGHFEVNHQAGKNLYNAAYWIENSKVKHVFRKSLLPTYDVFDESRYFEPFRSNPIINFKNKKIAVSICEDIWALHQNKEKSLYKYDPMKAIKKSSVDFIINLSASPYSIDKFDERFSLMSGLARRKKATLIYINQVGGNDELIFDGASLVVSGDGQIKHQMAKFEEDFFLYESDLFSKKPVNNQANKLYDLEKALVFGLKDYAQKCGFKKVCLGLSGGIDSALVATLAVKALGARHVEALLMPSRYSSKGSLKDSLELAKNLGISSQIISIKKIHQSYEKAFQAIFGQTKADLTEENIQARIRGNLLMALSNKKGHLVLTTGNKSETAVGYSTLYGDMSGGLAVISDLPKTMVYDLSRYINRHKEIIPQTIIDKAPSAELREEQKDSDSLPDYDILDEILRLYIEEKRSEKEIISFGFKKQTVKQIISLVKKNEYKRRQAPPGLRVTSKAFGLGRRFPIACRFD